MEKRRIESTSGMAASNGFMLSLKLNDDFREFIFYTEGYNRFSDKNNASWKFPACGGIAFCVLCLFITALKLTGSSGSQFYLGTFIAYISTLAAWDMLSLFFSINKREWHACEHKLSNLLNSEKPIDLENLVKSPKEHKMCGTRIGVTANLLFVYYFLIILLNLKIQHILGISFFWPLLFIFYIPYSIIMAGKLSLLTQKFITTKRPSEDKLRETLNLALRIDKFLHHNI